VKATRSRRPVIKFISRNDICGWAAAGGLLGQVVFTLAWVIAGLVQTHYDLTRQYMSDLGALTAQHPWIMNLGDSSSGLLTFGLAAGLWARVSRRVWPRLGVILVGVFGLGDVLDGFFRLDCATDTDPGCKARSAAGLVSWHHHAHFVESYVTVIALLMAPLVLSYGFRRDPAWQRLSTYSLISGAAMVSLAVLLGLQQGHSSAGLLQRGLVTVGLLWLAVLAWRLLRLPMLH
jgi:hypothetical protein